jgi:hypothetical protein
MPWREARLFILHQARTDLRVCRSRSRGRGVPSEEYGRKLPSMFWVYRKPDLFLKDDRVSRIEGKLEQLIDYIA